MGQLRDLIFKYAQEEEEGGTTPELEDVARYLNENEAPDDDSFHEWAEGKGYNVHEAEAKAYQLAAYAADVLLGGKAAEKNFTKADADPKELARGIEVEKEHTRFPEVAERIALGHLAEIPDYYSRLDKMEAEAKQQKAASLDQFKAELCGALSRLAA